MSSKLQALIVTDGSRGAQLYTNGESEHFEALKVKEPFYPVGCGDAFRGGLLRALSLGWDWSDAMHLASLMGAVKAGSPQAQGYLIDKKEIARLFRRAFGKEVSL